MSQESNRIANINSLDLVRGRYPDLKGVTVVGSRRSIDSADPENTIWQNPGTEDYTFTADGGATYYISSSDAGDTNTILLALLVDDGAGNWNPVTTFVALQGQTKVEVPLPAGTVGLPIRLNYMFTTNSADTISGAAGTVYVYEDDTVVGGVPSDASKIRGVIDPAINRLDQTVYTIPSGKVGYLVAATGFISRAVTGTADVGLYFRAHGGPRIQVATVNLNSEGASNYYVKYEFPFELSAKMDITVRILDVSNNNTSVSAALGILVEDN